VPENATPQPFFTDRRVLGRSKAPTNGSMHRTKVVAGYRSIRRNKSKPGARSDKFQVEIV
jgi:hypothetical protein